MATRSWFQWVDSAGRTRVTRVDTNALNAGALRLTMQNFSDAGLAAATVAAVGGPFTSPSAGVYGSVRDALQVTLLDNAGNQFAIYLPGPDASLFLADGVTAGGAFFTLLGTAIGNFALNPSSGQAVAKIQSGIRVGAGVP